MKKLLSLLGGLTIFASSTSTVVACKTNGNDKDKDAPTEEENDYLKLISELKTETNEIVQNHFSKTKVQDNLVAFSGSSDNMPWFNEENIKKYGTIEDDALSTFAQTITSDVEKEIFSNLQSVLDLSTLATEINLLGTEKGKYGIILDQQTVMDKNTFVDQSTSINYTTEKYEGAESEGEWLLSSTSITIKTIIKYKDQDNDVQRHTILVPIVFTWATDGILINKIKQIQNNILKDYYDEDTYSWLDMNTAELGYTKETSYEMFDLFDETRSDTGRRDKFQAVYKGEKFKEEFSGFVISKYLNEEPFANLGLAYYSPEGDDESYSSTIKSRIKDTANLKNFTSFLNNEDNYETARQDVLTKLEENGDIVKFKDYGDKAKNDTIYNILNNDTQMSLSKQFETYKKEFDEFNTMNEYKGNNADSISFMHGTVKIDDLQIVINDKFNLKINAFDIAYSVSVDLKDKISDNDDKNMVKDTSLGNAVYYNTVKGIQSFQNVFGTVSPTRKNLEKTSNEFLTPIAFTGVNADGALSGNIWDSLVDVKGSYTNDANKAFSLEKPASLTSFKNKLLTEGYQNDYDFGFTNYFSSKKEITPNTQGLYANYVKNNDGYYQQNPYPDFNSRMTSIKLEFNFVRIVFVITQFGTSGVSSTNSFIMQRIAV